MYATTKSSFKPPIKRQLEKLQRYTQIEDSKLEFALDVYLLNALQANI